MTQALHGTEPGDVGRLLTSASEVTGTVGASAGQLAQLVSGLDVSSRALVASDGALGQSIAGLDETLKVTPSALTAVDHALPPVTRLATALDPSLKQAPPLLSALSGVGRPADRRARAGAARTPADLAEGDVRAVPRRCCPSWAARSRSPSRSQTACART